MEVLTDGAAAWALCPTPQAPEQSCRVRFPDGAEEAFRRADLTIFKCIHSSDVHAIDPTWSRLIRCFEVSRLEPELISQ
jgi:hypothetical protein